MGEYASVTLTLTADFKPSEAVAIGSALPGHRTDGL